MKPLNAKERKKTVLNFIGIFVLALLLLFGCGYFTITTAQRGISILEERHTEYNAIFEKQANYNFKINEIIGDIHKLKSKDRTLNEHKQFQGIITDLRTDISDDILKDSLANTKKNHYIIYKEMLNQVAAIQLVLDSYEKQSETYSYDKELLEKCREKYVESLNN